MNLHLSSLGLPRLPGYSKSRSSPSNPCCRRNFIAWPTNSCRFWGVDSMAVILAVPKFQPPTPSRVFSWEFFCLASLKRANLEYRVRNKIWNICYNMKIFYSAEMNLNVLRNIEIFFTPSLNKGLLSSRHFWGPQWQSGNTLTSHLWGRGSVPGTASSG